MTHHLATLSAGEGSWLSAKVTLRDRVKPADTFGLVFTDTLYEDADAYRFLIEGGLNLFGRMVNWLPAAEDFPDYRVPGLTRIEDYHGNPAWRSFLAQLRDRTAEVLPELAWIVEGRDPWEVYRDQNYLGNSRKDPCSKTLKRRPLSTFIKRTCRPDDTIVYFGIGAGEKHRFEDLHLDRETGLPRRAPSGIRPMWAKAGWTVAAPLVDLEDSPEGELNPGLYVQAAGIKRSRQYGMGAAHNNCGGDCSKMGQKGWRRRLKVDPEGYAYAELMEGLVVAYIGRDVSMMTDRGGGGRVPLTLQTWRQRIEADPETADPPWTPGQDGCACALGAFLA